MAKIVGLANGNLISRYERDQSRIIGPLAVLVRHLAKGCPLFSRRG